MERRSGGSSGTNGRSSPGSAPAPDRAAIPTTAHCDSITSLNLPHEACRAGLSVSMFHERPAAVCCCELPALGGEQVQHAAAEVLAHGEGGPLQGSLDISDVAGRAGYSEGAMCSWDG